MSPDAPEDLLKTAALLISKLCDECITAQEAEQLDLLVRTNQQVRRLYVRMMHLQRGLYEYSSVLGVSRDADRDLAATEPLDPDNMNETMVLPALKETAGLDAFEELPGISKQIAQPAEHENRSPKKFVAGASIAAIILVGITILLVHLSGTTVKPIGIPSPHQVVTTQNVATPPEVVPEVPAIASVARLAGAVWGDAHAPTAGQKLQAGDEIWLKSGCAEIALATGGTAIVEGPAKLTLNSGSEVFLAYGQIAATIPGGGFAVMTPSGVLRDLGTQFGVAVKANGTTQVEVFEGRVTAELGSPTTQPAASQPAPMTLVAGQAAVISHATVAIDPGGAVPQRFVTRLTSDITSLDVVDLVSGGDGSTHRRAGAIDALTGRSGTLTAVNKNKGDGKIHPVPALPVIDCAFVPDGSKGTSTIDSAEHVFQFPKTSNVCINHISAGGTIPWFNSQGISTVLEGMDYSAAGHGLLCIHSNAGMTVDLAAIRRLYPDRLVSRFHCMVGNSYVNGTPNETAVDPRADVFVIVDGNSRFEKRQFTHQDGQFTVDVPIDPADHFLTLATTDGGDTTNDDWVLWVDPVLNLSSRP